MESTASSQNYIDHQAAMNDAKITHSQQTNQSQQTQSQGNTQEKYKVQRPQIHINTSRPTTKLPKPPVAQDFEVLNKTGSKSSSEKSDPLQRLEVETTSTASIPISFPYYYIDSSNNSFDTFNMLNKEKSLGEPLYSNTSHINNNLINTEQLATTDNAPKTKEFNQVPPRFSQFITQQQGRTLEPEVRTNSSFGSENEAGPIRRKSYSTVGTRPIKNSPKSNSPLTEGRYLLNRQISESMGSQATIFSTRLGGEKNKTNIYKTQSNNSSLTRRKAIRFKQGGLLYRMKLRIQKLLTRFKKLKFTTRASSKRTGSKRWNFRRNNKPVISNPITNPSLGQAGTSRVQTLDDRLKYQAGAPRENVNIPGPTVVGTNVNVPGPKNGKLNHLSEFIDQQQVLYLSDIDGKTNSINYGRDHQPRHRKSMGEYKSIGEYDDIEEIPLSEYSSAPPPPQHGNTTIINDYTDMVEMWRKYLVYVLYKRIQLRQEIGLYQTMILSQELKRKSSVGSALIYDIQESQSDTNSEVSDTGTITSGYETIESGLYTVSENTPTECSILSSVAEDEEPYVIHRFIPDADTEKFNRKYSNRQSVLGEMLDYSSDDDSTVTSVKSSTVRSNSIVSNLELGKQYSIKHKNLSRSLSSMSVNNKSPMKRSNGYQVGLNMV